LKRLVLLSVLVACAPTAAVTDFPEIEGWSPQTEVSSYDADSLWELINGAAETYMQYGFQAVETAELSREGTTLAVSIYDMGSALNAYGIYRTELPDAGGPLAVGAQAMVSPPYQALMAKDRFYVKVDVYDGALDEATGRAILETIAGSLQGSDGMPDEFAALPKKDRVAGSERFTREAFLGLRELQRCVSAEYVGGRTLFAVLPTAGSDVDATWQELSSKWKALDADGDAPVLVKKVHRRRGGCRGRGGPARFLVPGALIPFSRGGYWSVPEIPGEGAGRAAPMLVNAAPMRCSYDDAERGIADGR
jgi:hypothetical protein